MKITPRVSGEILHMAIGYNYNSRNFLGCISTEGYVITYQDDTYLYNFPENDSNFSILPVVQPIMLGRYLKVCNEI